MKGCLFNDCILCTGIFNYYNQALLLGNLSKSGDSSVEYITAHTLFDRKSNNQQPLMMPQKEAKFVSGIFLVAVFVAIVAMLMLNDVML